MSSKEYYNKHKEQITAQQRANYARKKEEQGETVRKAKSESKKEKCNMDCFHCIFADCIK